MSLFTETVTIVARSDEPTGQDDYGNDVYGEVETTSPAWLQQVNGTESTDAREQSVANMLLFLPLGPSLEAVDRIEWAGKRWEVYGEPGRQPGGFIVDGYQVVAIRKVTG